MYKKKEALFTGWKNCVINFFRGREAATRNTSAVCRLPNAVTIIFFFKLGASGGESIGDLLTSKDEQEVKKLKLSKEKNTISDDQVQGSKEANLLGIPAGPTKVC